MNDNKKKSIVASIAFVLLIIIGVSATYAYFKGVDAANMDTPLEVTTNTVDSLIFNIDADITLVADMSNFTEGLDNRVGEAHATATLKANNKTNSATGEYYLYLDIKENGLKYTTEDETPELLLQVNGPEGEVTSINGLNYVTVEDGQGNEVSGFDITTKQDLITIASKCEITTTSEKTDNWDVKVVFVNLDADQSANGGKKFNGQILIQKTGKMFADYIKNHVYTGTQGENNIYYHKNLANSAEDESYRYAGSYESVENYVCFGDLNFDGKCPYDKLYRIIGVFGSQVKLIKADYAKASELGTNGDYRSTYKEFEGTSNYGPSKGSNSKEELGVYYWNYSNGDNSKNVWAESRLNTINLNSNFLNTFSSAWQAKIATTNWQVGGNDEQIITYDTQPATAYHNEIVEPKNNILYKAKIGLMYVSDYLYGALPENWLLAGYRNDEQDYRLAVDSNWMYMGLQAWTITPGTTRDVYAYFIYTFGGTMDTTVYGLSGVIRPCFYLNSDVILTGGTGTQEDPYTIN